MAECASTRTPHPAAYVVTTGKGERLPVCRQHLQALINAHLPHGDRRLSVRVGRA